jgi:hypothetical protein
MRRARLTAGAVALATLVALLPDAGAHAALGASLTASAGGHRVHLVVPKGSTAAAASSNNLRYYGGPVEAAGSTNYAIFWEPAATAAVNAVSPSYNSLISRFFRDIGGSGLYGVAPQYYQRSGTTTSSIANRSTFGGAFVDTSSYPAPVLTDANIQAEVVKVMRSKGWTGGIGHQFFVFTGKNEISCAGAICSNVYFCAYHGSFVSGGKEILYANQPYATTLPAGCNAPTSPNGDLAADSTINVVSHELIETVTDPSVGDSRYAWQDTSGQEIGDKCNFVFGRTDSGGADLRVNGHGYIVQSEWSNRVSGCSMS